MKSYSLDLRKRIFLAVQHHEGTIVQIAVRFRVSVSFIVRLLQRYRQAGTLRPKPHSGGHPPNLTPEQLQQLLQLVHDHPDATLDELNQRLGNPGHRMTIFRALKKLGFSRKKKVVFAQERNSPRVRQLTEHFHTQLAEVDPAKMVFVDETGAQTNMTRRYGRAPVGQRVHDTVPGGWDSVTTIASMRLAGVGDCLSFPGGTDAQAFSTFVDQLLVPQLRPGDVVIWDNLSAHTTSTVKAVEAVGARVLPLPPYSPDLTPIEELFSKLKDGLRSLAARTTETLYGAIGTVLKTITPENILGWFKHCGYVQPKREAL